ncbi:MFS transporter [Photobacterium sp. CAU 1568]|uniref:MFS transporter n=1 Tax=Photobacterium arenosum TaxID=2774143 RepID=A0ABR9BLW8_9GAMM|nr:MFS transporter [Photobacterium arenosum]MBD8513557.1 MFS transporter [Photobacterium arenosum]
MSQNKMAFGGLCLGFFIVMMDTTTVPLIYTSLIKDFGVTPAMAAWVNNSYLIAYAAFLLLGGRLGDAYNRKILVSSALLLLSFGALLSGYGETLNQVIIGRAIMGVGAGLLTPQSMAFISIIFAEGGRGKAFGIWGAVAGIATATGPVVTQFFLQVSDWRWVMWINIPVAMIGLLVTSIYLPKTEGNGLKLKEFVFNGLFSFSIAIVILSLQLIHESAENIYKVLAFLALGVLGTFWLLRHEISHRSAYVLPFEIWKDRKFMRTCLISGLLGLGLTSLYLPLAYLIELRMNFGPVFISIIMVTIALANAVVGPVAGSLSDKIEPEVIIRYGLLSLAFSALLLGGVGLTMAGGLNAFVMTVIAMTFAGIGTGLAFAPLANLALRDISPQVIGRAAAFFNSTRQLLSALGSVIVALLFDYMVRNNQLFGLTEGNALQPYSPVVAYAAFACLLVIAGCVGLGAWLSREHTETENETVQS